MAKSKYIDHLDVILQMQDEGKTAKEIAEYLRDEKGVDALESSIRSTLKRRNDRNASEEDPDNPKLAEENNQEKAEGNTDFFGDLNDAEKKETEEKKEPEKPATVYKIPKEYKQLTERFTDQLFNLQVTVLELVGKSQDASAEAHKTLINQSKILQYVEDFGDRYKKASNDLELMTCELDGIIDNLKINARLRVWFFASAWLLSMAAALMAGYYVGRCLDPIALWYMVRALIIPGSFIAGAVLAIVVMICIQRKKNKNKKNDDEEE